MLFSVNSVFSVVKNFYSLLKIKQAHHWVCLFEMLIPVFLCGDSLVIQLLFDGCDIFFEAAVTVANLFFDLFDG